MDKIFVTRNVVDSSGNTHTHCYQYNKETQEFTRINREDIHFPNDPYFTMIANSYIPTATVDCNRNCHLK